MPAGSAGATTFFYDPATGTVAVDTVTSPTGKISMYELELPETGGVRYRPENHVRLSSSPWYMSEPDIVSDRSNTGGFSGYFNIGQVLPAGLSESAWQSLFPTPPSISWHDITPEPVSPPAPEPEPEPVSRPEPYAYTPISWFTPEWQLPVPDSSAAETVNPWDAALTYYEPVSYLQQYRVPDPSMVWSPTDNFSYVDGHRSWTSYVMNPSSDEDFTKRSSVLLDLIRPRQTDDDNRGWVETASELLPVRTYTPRPGAVSTSDIESNPAWQNAPVTFTYGLPDREFDNWANLLDPETLAWAQTAELRYNAATGGLTLDTTGTDSGFLSAFFIEGARAFHADEFVSPVDNALIAAATADEIVVITDLVAPGVYDLGEVLDAGLTREAVESLVASSSFITRTQTESGRFTQPLDGVGFRVVAVPEPTTAVLLTVCLLGAKARRTRVRR